MRRPLGRSGVGHQSDRALELVLFEAEETLARGAADRALVLASKAVRDRPDSLTARALLDRARREVLRGRRRERLESKVREAQRLLDTGDVTGAERIVTSALKLIPDHPLALGLFGRLKERRLQPGSVEAEAERELERLTRARAGKALEEARAALAAGWEPRALFALRRGLRLAPDDPDLLALLHDVQRAAERLEVDRARRRALLAQVRAGLDLLEQGQLPESLQILRAVLREDPDNARAQAAIQDVRRAWLRWMTPPAEPPRPSAEARPAPASKPATSAVRAKRAPAAKAPPARAGQPAIDAKPAPAPGFGPAPASGIGPPPTSGVGPAPVSAAPSATAAALAAGADSESWADLGQALGLGSSGSGPATRGAPLSESPVVKRAPLSGPPSLAVSAPSRTSSAADWDREVEASLKRASGVSRRSSPFPLILGSLVIVGTVVYLAGRSTSVPFPSPSATPRPKPAAPSVPPSVAPSVAAASPAPEERPGPLTGIDPDLRRVIESTLAAYGQALEAADGEALARVRPDLSPAARERLLAPFVGALNAATDLRVLDVVQRKDRVEVPILRTDVIVGGNARPGPPVEETLRFERRKGEWVLR